MSGDGLPTGTFHDRMAMFKDKEKASGNKPPIHVAPKHSVDHKIHTTGSQRVWIFYLCFRYLYL